MKQKFLFASLVGILFSFAASAQIVNSWRDPGTQINNPGLHKIVVAALINDQNVRKQIEDYMVSQYPGMATQSYILFGIMQPLQNNEETYNQTLRNEGYDGIVMMHQTSGDVTQRYVGGQPPSYRTWGGYWRNGWSYNPGTPGHVANDYTWFIQVNVYSIMQDKLIYAATARITDPGGRVPLFKNASDMVRGQMRTDSFLQ